MHLVDAGVLEFVHQEVLEAVIQAEHDLGGVILGEEIQSGPLQGDEIQGSLPGAELFIDAQGFSHQDDQVLERRGFLGGRPGGGQVPALLQDSDHRTWQVLDQGGPFFLVKALGEAVFNREPLARVSLLGKQNFRQGLPGRYIRRGRAWQFREDKIATGRALQLPAKPRPDLSQGAARQAGPELFQGRLQRHVEPFFQELPVSGRIPADPGQGQEISQAVPPGQQPGQLSRQAAPVVVEAHQSADEGLAHRVPGASEIQAAAHLLQGFDFKPAGLVFFQQGEFQRRPGLLGGQLQELGPEAVEGHDGQTLRGQLKLSLIAVAPENRGRQFPEPQIQGGGIRPRGLAFPEEGHDPGAQLAGGLAGKGQGQHLLGGVHPGQEGEKPGQEHRSFAGACRSLQVKAF